MIPVYCEGNIPFGVKVHRAGLINLVRGELSGSLHRNVKVPLADQKQGVLSHMELMDTEGSTGGLGVEATMVTALP